MNFTLNTDIELTFEAQKVVGYGFLLLYIA